MKTIMTVVFLVIGGAIVSRGAIVYSDDFNRSTLSSGTYTYTTTVTAGDGAAAINNNILDLTNDGSASGNANGRVFVTTPTSAFASPYQAQLDQNPGVVTWTFNMRQIRTDPSGFENQDYGCAFVLGASGSDLMTANGYAVVLGQSGTTDPIRLVRFANGLNLNTHLHNIVSASSPLADIGDQYLSLRVSYDPADNRWSVYGRNDGAAFADPTTGTLTSVGNATDPTYVGTSLTHLGVLWNYNYLESQTADFDNFSIEAVPEPVNVALGCFAGVFVLASVCRRLRARLKAE